LRAPHGAATFGCAREGASGPREGPQAHLDVVQGRRATPFDRPPRLRTAGHPEVIVMDPTVDLARARREAKALLRAARAGDPDAAERIGTPNPQLSDAQLAIARELGARSWPALVRRVEAGRAFVLAATSGRRGDARALAPGFAYPGLDAALVLGDAETLAGALRADPVVATREIGARRWPALLYVTHSVFLGGERTTGLLACARALLDAGADPDAAREDAELERMTALNGAAGVAHEPRMTALLLGAGADPDDGRSLRMAAGAGDPACLELLLDAGATLQRSMALAHAAQRGALACARVLLDRGPRDWGERENALVWAVRGEAPPQMLRLLAEHGADLEASFDASGRTPYGDAIRAGRRDLADVLASLGARRRADPLDEILGACLAGDVDGARQLAAQHPDAARLLRTSEADALPRAAGRGRRAAVKALLDLGVPVDARGPMGETALEAARGCGDDVIAALLVERGADPRKRAPREGDEPRQRGRPAPAAPARASSLGPRRRRPAPEPPYAELAWAAEAAYLRILASSPLAETRAIGDGFAVVTGIDDNTENGVVCDRADDAALREALAFFVDRHAPAQWLIGPGSDLGGRLVAAGASPERTGVVMGAQLDRRSLDAPPPGVTIVAVRDAAGLAAWREVAGAALFDDAEQRARLADSLGLGAEAPVQHRLALRDGRLAGVAMFVVHEQTMYGRHLGVLAPERRGGIGRALVHHVLAEARQAGATAAVLGPTPDTIAFYRLIGFVLRGYVRDRSFYLPSR
jgi:ankyrin repeat protein/GNAT superfamily N-acetyltransferase